MILLSARKVRLVVQRDGGIWSFPTWTRSRLQLHRHPEVSLEVVEETLLILQDFLLELVAVVPRWMFSSPDLLQGFWFVCDWKNKFSLFGKCHLFRIESFRVDFQCVHRLQLLKVCDQCVTLPNSPRVQCASEEQSREDFLSKLMDSWLILRSYREILN